jgi:hypothetical protein
MEVRSFRSCGFHDGRTRAHRDNNVVVRVATIFAANNRCDVWCALYEASPPPNHHISHLPHKFTILGEIFCEISKGVLERSILTRATRRDTQAGAA